VIDASGHRIGIARTAKGLTIRFRLPKKTPLTLVLRGPLPSCAAVRRMNIRGQKGLNRVRIQPLNRRHRLAPGTYLLSAVPTGNIDRLPVRVLRTGRVVRATGLSVAAACTRNIVSGASVAGARVSGAGGSALSASRRNGGGAASQLAARAHQVGPQTGVKRAVTESGILGASHVAAPSAARIAGGGSSGIGVAVILAAVALALGIPVLVFFAARSGVAKTE